MALACGHSGAANVPLESVETTFSRFPADLPMVIDRKDMGRSGWSVFPQTDKPQSLMVTTATPFRARWFDLTLCFLSGLPGNYLGEFTVSYTTDPSPSFSGKWQKIIPEQFTSTGPDVDLRTAGSIRPLWSNRMIGDAIFQLKVRGPQEAVTGFRIDAFPFLPGERVWNGNRWPGNAEGPGMSWTDDRDFCLTEFRVDATQASTTNVALGCPVTASHALWQSTPGEVLTDGLPGSFNHPEHPGLGAEFHFDIDLGSVYEIDHIGLRSRADGNLMDRMSQVLVQVYEESPSAGGKPVWQAMDREDGSYPEAGAIDILRASDGEGRCRGRFLRISSDSLVALSPQIAEVEVYPVLTPAIVFMNADGKELAQSERIRVAAGTRMLTVMLDAPGAVDPITLRWRLLGSQDDWQIIRGLDVEIPRPSPGAYEFEAQIRHTDGKWNTKKIHIPLVVADFFWRSPWFYWPVLGCVVIFGQFLTRRYFRLQEKRRHAEIAQKAALMNERTRIARDMHDEVGAHLSQIAMMQDLLIGRELADGELENRMQAISGETRRVLASLDEVVWAVDPEKDTLSGVAEYLTHVTASYLGPLEISFRLHVQQDFPSLEVRAGVRHHLIQAFREALQNVVKHSGASVVTLRISFNEGKLVIQISDNGCGIDGASAGVGEDGLKNMRQRLEIINGNCSISRSAEGGTCVEFTAALTDDPTS